MSKALYLNVPAHGHVNPSLPVVTALIARGEEIVYVNNAEFREAVTETGARFIPYPSGDSLKHLIANASGGHLAQNALALFQIGEHLIDFVQQVIDDERPDYLIYDSLACWGPMSAQMRELPTIATISTFAISRNAMPPIGLAAMAHMLAGLVRVFPAYWQTARRIRQQHPIQPTALPDVLMNLGDLNIVFTSQEFQPNSTRFDESFRFVGPSIGKRANQADFPFKLLTREQLVIYISLGTINNQNITFYQQCFEALGDYPAQVILSIGRQTKLESLGSTPTNFIVRDFVPQLDVLQHAHVFVTHGGLNSAHEGLLAGVPLVVIPQQIEQSIVARQIASKGAGIAVGVQPPFGQVTSSQIRQAVERVLGPEGASFRQQAQQLGDSLRQAGGSARAVDEILAFVGRAK